MDKSKDILDNYLDVLNFAEWSNEVLGTPPPSEIKMLFSNLALLKSCYDENCFWADRFDPLHQVKYTY